MEVSLVMFKADGTRRDFPVKKARFVVGRTTNCDLRIPLSSVSREHCEIRLEGNRLHLRDLGSSNGTHHNSSRVQEVMLKAGDEIAVGPVVFTLVIDGQPANVQPVHLVDERGIKERTAKAPPPEKPSELTSHDVEVIPVAIEPEVQTPTVDLDDPMSALGELAKSEDENLEDLPLLAEEDDDPPPPPKK